jgi:hypothetical protein
MAKSTPIAHVSSQTDDLASVASSADDLGDALGEQQPDTRRAAPARRRAPTPTPGPPSADWVTVATSPAFLHALAVAAAVICAVLLSPIAVTVQRYAPALSAIPCAEAVIQSVVAAALLTVLRPPQI